jgi:photosystem II stability/assembly factor-like uncharacterized protein
MKHTLSRREFGGLTIVGACAAVSPARALDMIGQPQNAWIKLPTVPFKGKQDDISFADADFGFYGNGEGKLYRTNDRGASWAKIWDRPGTFVRALGFIDRNVGFLGNVGTDYYPGVTDKNPLYRSKDGGMTWDAVTAPGIDKVAGICGIDILPVSRIYQGELRTSHIIHAAGRVGGPAMIMRSEDSGDSWTVIDLSAQAEMILDVKFLSPKVGFVCASSPSETGQGNAMMLRTMDGGKSWKTVYQSKRPHENCWKMSWPTEKIGYATVQSYVDAPNNTRRVFVKTTDGGKSWKEMPLVNDKAAHQFGIAFVDAKRGWIGTRSGGFETMDGGLNWKKTEFGKAVNKIRVVAKPGGGKVAYAIGVDVHRLDI